MHHKNHPTGAPILLGFLISALAFSSASAQDYVPWPEEAVEVFDQIPIQHDGRVKPMRTVGHWILLELSGRTKLATVSKEEERTYKKPEMPPGREGVPRKLTSSEWLMDTLFRPTFATKYPVFLVDDSNAVTAIGAEAKIKKRNYYSYADLLPGREKLAELARTYAQKKEKKQKLTSLEDQIMLLGRKVNTFEF
ncbi:MAG: hypothetical protein AAGJ31_15100, partial [Verrucomicrobiota bacterium]